MMTLLYKLFNYRQDQARQVGNDLHAVTERVQDKSKAVIHTLDDMLHALQTANKQAKRDGQHDRQK
jgi:hypothetical protein